MVRVSSAMELSLKECMELVDISTGVFNVTDGKVNIIIFQVFSCSNSIFLPYLGDIGHNIRPDFISDQRFGRESCKTGGEEIGQVGMVTPLFSFS